ncbi:hypothetical protein K450DRAFT_263845 [Umbelopsis ramanniana AG]|uniref:Uncharacterized protein n=1 Tax=Umbelopsis ramanniana AG TaxID=1314678 RepID=A0AAD5E0T5_UMBRA|nr:uncharacterized protein K450DRAFT_263845 [Umbelopsis ramanniana AG]KAI8574987.1 hypothetical protein K450DRAFT_263845 [Umbelopsis ramanniana AG]
MIELYLDRCARKKRYGHESPTGGESIRRHRNLLEEFKTNLEQILLMMMTTHLSPFLPTLASNLSVKVKKNGFCMVMTSGTLSTSTKMRVSDTYARRLPLT